MIIAFRGTSRGKNNAPQALALCAGISATMFKQKTIVIQLTPTCPIEDYLIGKQLAALEITAESYSFDDSGIDSLFRRRNISKFEGEHFDNAVVPLVTAERLFDVLKISKKPASEFDTDIINNPDTVKKIIKDAADIYDNVFVYVNGKSEEIIKITEAIVDKTVICLHQGKKENIIRQESATEFLISPYNNQSTFSRKVIAKMYNIPLKNTHEMPYNVVFHDYYTSGNALQFVLHNSKCSEDDVNYEIMNSMREFVEILLDRKVADDEEFINFDNKKIEYNFDKPKTYLKEDFVTFEEQQISKNVSKTVSYINENEVIQEINNEYGQIRNSNIATSSQNIKEKEELDNFFDDFDEYDEPLNEININEDYPIEEKEETKKRKFGLFGKKKNKTQKEETNLKNLDWKKEKEEEEIQSTMEEDFFMYLPTEKKNIEEEIIKKEESFDFIKKSAKEVPPEFITNSDYTPVTQSVELNATPADVSKIAPEATKQITNTDTPLTVPVADPVLPAAAQPVVSQPIMSQPVISQTIGISPVVASQEKVSASEIVVNNSNENASFNNTEKTIISSEKQTIQPVKENTNEAEQILSPAELHKRELLKKMKK